MAKMNGHIWFTAKQLKMMSNGKVVPIRREGKITRCGLKPKHSQTLVLVTKIRNLENQLAQLQKKEKAEVTSG